jgi:hypothetical protein
MQNSIQKLFLFNYTNLQNTKLREVEQRVAKSDDAVCGVYSFRMGNSLFTLLALRSNRRLRERAERYRGTAIQELRNE